MSIIELSLSLATVFALLVVSIVCGGCRAFPQAQTWHEEHGWIATDYFSELDVVELCYAIERSDLEEIDRLIQDGVDINTKGKSNMTPLLWALPIKETDAFELLLKSGADPNVRVTSICDAPEMFTKGDAVTILSCFSNSNKFELVFENGGDPNFVTGGFGITSKKGQTPIFAVVRWGTKAIPRLKLLKEKGADFNYLMPAGSREGSVAMVACRKKKYDVCLFVLNNGTDFDLYDADWTWRLIDLLAESEEQLPWNEEDRRELVNWLEDSGESIAETVAELKEQEKAMAGKSAKQCRVLHDAIQEKNRLAFYRKRQIDLTTLPLGVGYWHERHPIAMSQAPDIKDFRLAAKQWHGDYFKFKLTEDWSPGSFFEDKKAIELCDAIADVDLQKMKRLLDGGLDVNTQGKGGMNPLFYAYHVVHNSDPFELLLDYGANPNLLVDLQTKPLERKKSRLTDGFAEISVTHLVTRNIYNRLFKKLYEASDADPNLKAKTTKGHAETPFQQLNQDGFAFPARLQLLIEKNADLDVRFGDGTTMLSRWCAIHGIKSYAGALRLLKGGADFRLVYKTKNLRRGGSNFEGCSFRLVHYLAETEASLRKRSSDLKWLYEVVNWLEDNGESFQKAQEDLARWKKLIEEEHRKSKKSGMEMSK